MNHFKLYLVVVLAGLAAFTGCLRKSNTADVQAAACSGASTSAMSVYASAAECAAAWSASGCSNLVVTTSGGQFVCSAHALITNTSTTTNTNTSTTTNTILGTSNSTNVSI